MIESKAINQTSSNKKPYPKLMINDMHDSGVTIIILATNERMADGDMVIEGTVVYTYNCHITAVGYHGTTWNNFRDYDGEIILRNK